MKLERPLIFFDTETTGVDTIHDRIVELCAVKIFPEGQEDPVMKTIRFNPTIPIPKEATDIHGITDEDVKNEPTFKRVAKSMFKWFVDSDLGGYNGRFDVAILFSEFYRAGIEHIWDFKLADPLEIWRKNEPRSLSDAVRYFLGWELEDAHSAQADTLGAIEVLKAQIKKYELDSFFSENGYLDIDGKIVNTPDGPVYGFGKSKGVLVKDDPGFGRWMLDKDFHWSTKKVVKDILGL